MPNSPLENFALGVSGLTALGIGTAILANPPAFFTAYGIEVGEDASLLSELRAPAAGLAAFGAVMLMGIWRPSLALVSRITALTVFLAFPAGRVVGMIADGLPSDAVLGALAFELIVAVICIVAFRRHFVRREAHVPRICVER